MTTQEDDLWWQPLNCSDFWRRKDDQWLYVKQEGQYFKATLDQHIDCRVIGGLFAAHSNTYQTGTATMQGIRKTQEDRFYVQEASFLPYCSEQTSLIVIADGHVGDCAAEFAVRNLPHEIKARVQAEIAQHCFHSLEQASESALLASETSTNADKDEQEESSSDENKLPCKRGIKSDSSTNKVRREETSLYIKRHPDALLPKIAEALKAGYREIDQQFLSLNRTSKAGSTCTSLLLIGDLLAVSHIGDSRAVLVTKPEKDSKTPTTIPLTIEHKPGEPLERKRIQDLGGSVKKMGGCWRVIPDVEPGTRTAVALAVSRSFGDRSLKNYVISEPETRFERLTSDHHMAVVVATDGVWDTLTNDKVGEIIWPFYQARNAEEAARAIIKSAFLRGSEDNITCAVLFIFGNGSVA